MTPTHPTLTPEPTRPSAVKPRRLHPAWMVAVVAFVTLIGAAGFRSAPGVFIVPLQDEFGWSRSVLSLAVGVNLVLFGLTAPFAAALIDRFGIRLVTSSALTLIAVGSGLSVFVTASWQLVLLWGLVIGTGTGAMALVFAATIANRWFVRNRGLVMGVLTAGSATGQLIFLPVLAWLADGPGWRTASVVIALGALAVVPLVLAFLRDTPADKGVLAYGAALTDADAAADAVTATEVAGQVMPPSPTGAGRRVSIAATKERGAEPVESRRVSIAATKERGAEPVESRRVSIAATKERGAEPVESRRVSIAATKERGAEPVESNAARRALTALRAAARTKTFWSLAAGFAICGATTNGLIGTHFIPAAHDHGLPETTAAGLLAVVGVFDIAGTIASGYLTDRVNPRILLATYYGLRGIGLLMLPSLLSSSLHPNMIAFVVVHGLDWVATVPPTVALCREAFGDSGTIVFGWVFASHQIGAAMASVAAGVIRDHSGSYTIAWFGAAGMCAIAAVISIGVARTAAIDPYYGPTLRS